MAGNLPPEVIGSIQLEKVAQERQGNEEAQEQRNNIFTLDLTLRSLTEYCEQKKFTDWS